MEGGSHRPTAFGWLNYSEANGEVAGSVGGVAIRMLAALTLNIGDIVYVSAATTVSKSSVVANYATVLGVVVGGQNTDMSVIQDDAIIGTFVAALVNQPVLVCIHGIAKILSDTAAIAAGVKITGSGTTAGRGTVTGAAAGNFAGITITASAGAGVVQRILVNLA